jgi:Domain of unknown function (DUF4124)
MAGLAFAAAAAAQSKWVDKDGRVTYGDAPPQGVNAQSMRRTPSGYGTQAEASDVKDDAKKPLTAAEQDAESRKRRQEAEKDREKQAKAEQAAADRRENCARSQENVRALESGRVARTDAQGERYFLDDAQLGQEMVRARQGVREWCN